MKPKRTFRQCLPWLATFAMILVLAGMWYSEEILAFLKKGSGSGALFSDGSGASQQGVSQSSANATSLTSADLLNITLRESLVKPKGDGTDRVTVLVYLNGSDLETKDGEATMDLTEMIAAGAGGNVNLAVETIGTERWRTTYGISNKTSQRFAVTESGLTLVQDKLGYLDVGDGDNLADFIRWGAETYPADRYILILWNHGGGPVYGYGYDDKTESSNTLTAYEIRQALAKGGVTFDLIGMDCCIMSSLELCCALYDYCDYALLSEDFESGYGWYYTDWLKALRENSSLSTEEIGKLAVDGTVNANARYRQDSILALIDEAYMKVLYSAWVNFAYANEETLLNTNYARVKSRRPGGRISPVLYENSFFLANDGRPYQSDVSLNSYFVTDIMAVAQNISGEEAQVLSSVLSKAVNYMNAYGDSANLTGLSVTLPYGDAAFYRELKQVLLDCGFDTAYVTWLEKFVKNGNSSQFYDYDEWDRQWEEEGWGSFDDGDFGWLFGLYDDGYTYDDYVSDFGDGWGWSRP